MLNRQNKILKVVYGILHLTPKARVWLGEGTTSPGSRRNPRWSPVVPEYLRDEENGDIGPRHLLRAA